MLPGDDDHRLTPVDNGNVCVNVDTTWFADEGIPEPESLDDLVDPAYQDLFVLPGAASSSTGLAFLLATIAEYGDDWPDYWTRLMDNGAKLTAGWSDAYEVDFTQGGGEGDRPIVLSYDSSPAFTDRRRREHDEGAARHLLPPGGVRRRAHRRRTTPTAPRRSSTGCCRRRCRRRCRTSMYVFPVDAGDDAAGRVGVVRRAARRARCRSTPPTSPSTATSG